MWTLAFGHHEDRTPTHGYEPTREAAMAAFANSVGGRNICAAARRVLREKKGPDPFWNPIPYRVR
jgi:hypothetical protein